MDFNFPSINTNIIDELNSMYDELIAIKKRECEFQFSVSRKYILIENTCNNVIKTQENKINLLTNDIDDVSDHIIGQQKKIDLIHNLFNIYKNNNDKFKYNDNKIKDIIFNSNQMSIFDEKISEVRSSSNILEKSYQELYSLNKNLNNKVDKLEKKLEIQEEKILYLVERLTLNEEQCLHNTKQSVEKEHHKQESNNEWTKVIKSGNKKISYP